MNAILPSRAEGRTRPHPRVRGLALAIACLGLISMIGTARGGEDIDPMKPPAGAEAIGLADVPETVLRAARREAPGFVPTHTYATTNRALYILVGKDLDNRPAFLGFDRAGRLHYLTMVEPLEDAPSRDRRRIVAEARTKGVDATRCFKVVTIHYGSLMTLRKTEYKAMKRPVEETTSSAAPGRAG